MRVFQEKIYSFEWKENGAGPLWCLGSSCIAEFDNRVFVSAWETFKDVLPLNCAFWSLYERSEDGWKVLYRDKEKTREPAPICVLNDGKIFVSENPFMLELEGEGGVTLPGFSIFYPPDYSKIKKVLFYPCESVVFNDHSYRNFSADRENSQMIIFQNKGYDRAYWVLLDENGNTIKNGKIYWPYGYDYAKPQRRIRLCYNNVQLKNRAVYIFGTSDILEPNPEWRRYKKELTGRDWDYDFRRLFFTYTWDIQNEPFRYWFEISSREKTAGKTLNCDLFVDDNEFIHLLWFERSCDLRLRDKFFPNEPLTHSLRYAKLKGSRILEQKNILFFQENEETPSGILKIDIIWAKFHITKQNQLHIFATISGLDKNNKKVAENWLFEMDSNGSIINRHHINFDNPFTFFHLASVRNGCAPSNRIHIYGSIIEPNNEMYYGCIDLDG